MRSVVSSGESPTISMYTSRLCRTRLSRVSSSEPNAWRCASDRDEYLERETTVTNLHCYHDVMWYHKISCDVVVSCDVMGIM